MQNSDILPLLRHSILGQRPTSRLPSEGLMKRNDNIKEGQNMFIYIQKVKTAAWRKP